MQNNAAIGNKSQSTSQDKGLAKRMMVLGKKLRDIWHFKKMENERVTNRVKGNNGFTSL